MTVSDYIADFLLSKGITEVFTLTGNGSMFLADAFYRKLKLICGRNEAALPVMAKAWAKLKGKPGAILLTAGPGAMNCLGGLAECWVDSVPMLVFSGQ